MKALMGMIVGALLTVTALVFGVLAIWTVGPDSSRWAATAGLIGVPGFFLAFISTAAWDLRERR